jgi:hypothetical protein
VCHGGIVSRVSGRGTRLKLIFPASLTIIPCTQINAESMSWRAWSLASKFFYRHYWQQSQGSPKTCVRVAYSAAESMSHSSKYVV